MRRCQFRIGLMHRKVRSVLQPERNDCDNHNTRWRSGHLRGRVAATPSSAVRGRPQSLGYKSWTLRRYEEVALRFCAAVEVRGLGADDLDGSQIEQLHAAVVDATTAAARTNMRFCLNRFINSSRGCKGGASARAAAESANSVGTLQQNTTHIPQPARLSDSTIYDCHASWTGFMTFRFGGPSAISTTFHRRRCRVPVQNPERR